MTQNQNKATSKLQFFKQYSLAMVLILVLHADINAQNQLPDPKIGELFPNYTFREVNYFSNNVLSTQKMKGKWLILDFWNEECIACVKSFPEVNRVQEKFKYSITYVLVGYNASMNGGGRTHIKGLYETIRKTEDLKLIIAYDSALYRKLQIGDVGCPYIIVIDPNGITRYVTGHLHENDVTDIINDKKADLSPINRSMVDGYKNSKVEIKELQDSSMSVQTKLFKVNKFSVLNSISSLPNDTLRIGKFSISGVTLDILYRYAFIGEPYSWPAMSPYYGQVEYNPALEIVDSSIFRKENKYSFEISTKKIISKTQIREYLKDILQSSFNLRVNMEQRDCNYWRLALIDSSYRINLLSKGNAVAISYPSGKFTSVVMKNVPMKQLIRFLWSNFQLNMPMYGHPFIDETNINGNIDISIDGTLMADFKAMQEKLLENGIKIDEAKRKMLCMVIKNK